MTLCPLPVDAEERASLKRPGKPNYFLTLKGGPFRSEGRDMVVEQGYSMPGEKEKVLLSPRHQSSISHQHHIH